MSAISSGDTSTATLVSRKVPVVWMMRGAFYWLGLLVLLAALTSCGRIQKASPDSRDEFTVTVVTEPSPPAVGQGLVIATLKDKSGQPVDGAQLQVEANMSHAGMVPVLARAGEGPAGSYRVPINWSMSGDWYLDVKFTLPDGQRVTRRFPVSVR